MAAPTFTPLPTPPSRSGMTGTAFSNATDAFLAAWSTLQAEGDALGVFCETQADAALSAAVAGNLAALDLTALAGWVIGVNAGGTALEGVELIAPSQATEIAAGVAELATTAEAQAGTDDLTMMTSLKTKQAISFQVGQSAQWRDERASGTEGGPSLAGWNTRVINTENHNNITGASLALNQITLAAGTYEIDALAISFESLNDKLSLFNVTDSTYDLVGMSTRSSYSNAWPGVVRGKITIASTKVFEIRHYIASASAIRGLGVAISSGSVEVYTEINVKVIPS